jgi:hypothetical protein
MRTVFRVDSAGFERRRATQSHKTWILLAGVTAIAVLSASCAPTLPAAVAGPDPADPNVRVPAVQYRSTIASYRSRRPVEPGPWQKQDESVKPNSEH